MSPLLLLLLLLWSNQQNRERRNIRQIALSCRTAESHPLHCRRYLLHPFASRTDTIAWLLPHHQSCYQPMELIAHTNKHIHTPHHTYAKKAMETTKKNPSSFNIYLYKWFANKNIHSACGHDSLFSLFLLLLLLLFCSSQRTLFALIQPKCNEKSRIKIDTLELTHTHRTSDQRETPGRPNTITKGKANDNNNKIIYKNKRRIKRISFIVYSTYSIIPYNSFKIAYTACIIIYIIILQSK